MEARYVLITDPGSIDPNAAELQVLFNGKMIDSGSGSLELLFLYPSLKTRKR